jgi:hypothetical protein
MANSGESKREYRKGDSSHADPRITELSMQTCQLTVAYNQASARTAVLDHCSEINAETGMSQAVDAAS